MKQLRSFRQRLKVFSAASPSERKIIQRAFLRRFTPKYATTARPQSRSSLRRTSQSLINPENVCSQNCRFGLFSHEIVTFQRENGTQRREPFTCLRRISYKKDDAPGQKSRNMKNATSLTRPRPQAIA